MYLVGREEMGWCRDGLCVLAGTVQLDESTKIGIPQESIKKFLN